MSFWGQHNQSTGEFEQKTELEPIPAKTQVLAAITEAKWDEMGEKSDAPGERYISLTWTIAQPAEYNSRKVFQKLRVYSDKKGDTARQMLAAIAANAGGGLLKINAEPTDQELMKHLMNRNMVLLLQIWEMKGSDGEKMRGNWISKVSPYKKTATKTAPPVEETTAPTANDDDDIPF
jgi:hypothetical protein